MPPGPTRKSNIQVLPSGSFRAEARFHGERKTKAFKTEEEALAWKTRYEAGGDDDANTSDAKLAPSTKTKSGTNITRTGVHRRPRVKVCGTAFWGRRYAT